MYPFERGRGPCRGLVCASRGICKDLTSRHTCRHTYAKETADTSRENDCIRVVIVPSNSGDSLSGTCTTPVRGIQRFPSYRRHTLLNPLGELNSGTSTLHSGTYRTCSEQNRVLRSYELRTKSNHWMVLPCLFSHELMLNSSSSMVLVFLGSSVLDLIKHGFVELTTIGSLHLFHELVVSTTVYVCLIKTIRFSCSIVQSGTHAVIQPRVFESLPHINAMFRLGVISGGIRGRNALPSPSRFRSPHSEVNIGDCR